MDEATIQRRAGRPTREKSAEIADLVLDRAREAFCRSGFTETSMDKIAQQLGASKLTIYRRFESKEGLLIAIVDRDIARLHSVMCEAVAIASTPLDSLRMVARSFLDYDLKPENIAFRYFLQSEAARRPAIAERWDQWTETVSEPLVELISRAQRAGEISGRIDARALAELLVDLLVGAVERLRGGARTLSLAEREAFFDLRWKAFVGLATA